MVMFTIHVNTIMTITIWLGFLNEKNLMINMIIVITLIVFVSITMMFLKKVDVIFDEFYVFDDAGYDIYT